MKASDEFSLRSLGRFVCIRSGEKQNKFWGLQLKQFKSNWVKFFLQNNFHKHIYNISEIQTQQIHAAALWAFYSYSHFRLCLVSIRFSSLCNLNAGNVQLSYCAKSDNQLFFMINEKLSNKVLVSILTFNGIWRA